MSKKNNNSKMEEKTVNPWLSIMMQDEKNVVASQVVPKVKIPAASPSLNWALSGGFTLGDTICLYGPEGCLAGDTFIQYEIRTQDGERQNHKGGSLERLYKRFHGIPVEGKGSYQRSQTIESDFFVSSINEEGRIIKNKVLDVVDSGVKNTFKITTAMGYSLVATKDHKFYTKDGFKPLGELSPGDIVFVHNNTPHSVENKKRVYRPEILVKYHHGDRIKNVKDGDKEYTYFRVRRSRAVVEAHLNRMTLNQYISFLNTASKSEIDALVKIPDGHHVHHLNENPQDDSIDNLIVVDSVEHNKKHALDDQDNLRFVAVEDTILEIAEVGEIQTYDIKCAFPYNNFVANNLVVHNSGKSLASMLAVAALHKADPEAVAVLVTSEMRAPSAARLLPLGVDPDRLFIRCANTLHDVFDWITSKDSVFKNSDGSDGAPGLLYMLMGDKERKLPPLKARALIIDSIKGIQGPKEQAAKSSEDTIMGDLSKYLNPALRQILPVIRKYDIMTILVQQVNMNMDADEVKYQNKKWTVPSGQSLKHFCEKMALIERVNSKDSKIFNDSMHSIRELPVQEGHTIRVKVEKDNSDSPFREAEFQIHYKKGVVNVTQEVCSLAINLGIISHPLNDKGTEIRSQFVFGDNKWIGFDKMVAELETRPEVVQEIMNACYRM